MSSRKYLSGFSSLVLGLALCAAWAANAGDLSSLLGSPKTKASDAVLVTGNFVESRLLAELIQYRTGFDVVLLPSGSEKSSYFFLGPRGRALELRDDTYLWAIDYINPKTIYFLGDEKYAPQKYFDMLVAAKRVPVRVAEREWSRVIDSMAETLKISNLQADYKKALEQWNKETVRRGIEKPQSMDELFGGK